MGKVIDIEANMEHKTSEVICVKCGSRWISVRPTCISLKELICEKCGAGFVIETGEVIDESEE